MYLKVTIFTYKLIVHQLWPTAVIFNIYNKHQQRSKLLQRLKHKSSKQKHGGHTTNLQKSVTFPDITIGYSFLTKTDSIISWNIRCTKILEGQFRGKI
jgi:hypothetical protein